ncbi:hypothetical protein OW763_06265 [Clostridium aestuarii]|uniref:Mannosyl-glycoprotein endo-beta-N-acetylglucosamidase-like domain-containing protein n=1 Tax=Clostridium aestuarii TaxID=338193 RepID=A0ABT4CZY6_9CLOT|nr:hypothetical protein [Clostridium aestuarii]MCY6483952.1 hypothetical protein [Clostridium aestuarii]
MVVMSQKNIFFSTKDYKGQTRALKVAEYATDPNYSKQLINLIERYKLYQYDKENKQKRTYSINYCLEWQKFYNKATETVASLMEDRFMAVIQKNQ